MSISEKGCSITFIRLIQNLENDREKFSVLNLKDFSEILIKRLRKVIWNSQIVPKFILKIWNKEVTQEKTSHQNRHSSIIKIMKLALHQRRMDIYRLEKITERKISQFLRIWKEPISSFRANCDHYFEKKKRNETSFIWIWCYLQNILITFEKIEKCNQRL